MSSNSPAMAASVVIGPSALVRIHPRVVRYVVVLLPMSPAPEDLHEWLSFEDPDEERTWVFDLTFLTSSWTCIYGQGCQGVLTGPAPELVHGCCSYGAHFIDDDDLKAVEEAAARLTAADWQYKKKADKT